MRTVADKHRSYLQVWGRESSLLKRELQRRRGGEGVRESLEVVEAGGEVVEVDEVKDGVIILHPDDNKKRGVREGKERDEMVGEAAAAGRGPFSSWTASWNPSKSSHRGPAGPQALKAFDSGKTR